MIRTPSVAGIVLALSVAAGGPAAADVWDNATDPDDDITTDNRLIHGAVQVHDLAFPGAFPDEDFFLVDLVDDASYEVTVDSHTGDLDFVTGGSNSDIVRMDGNGGIAQNALGFNGLVPLRWKRTAGSGNAINFIRVRSSSCGVSCSNSDQYTIRFRETTYSIPRFNNSATQFTILIVNNLGGGTCSMDIDFHSSNGAYLGTSTQSLNPAGTLVLNTATLPFAAGVSGTVKVIHTCPYGSLTGKGVAVEPGTGFTFDTPMVALVY